MSSPDRPAGEQHGRWYTYYASTGLELLIDQRVIKVQHDNPRSNVAPDQTSDCYTDIDDDSTTVKNAVNINASTIQYKTGLFFMESSVVISIS